MRTEISAGLEGSDGVKKAIYLMTSGRLKREADTICFIVDKKKRFIPVEDVSEIHVFSELDLNKKILEFFDKKEIILHFYNHYGYYVGSFYPRKHLNSGYMTLKQAEVYLNYETRLELARGFVEGAVKNMRQVLTYYQNRGKNLEDILSRVNVLGDNAASCATIEELMAVEGNIRDAYYGCFDEIISDENFVFKARSKRPPANRLNALISFGNTMLYNTTLSEIYRTHLDPRIGFLHASNFRRFSLNLDVAEVFKPIIVDRLIFSLLRRRIMAPNHFEKKLGGIVLNKKGRQIFVKEYDNKLMNTIKHRQLGRNVSYRRLIRMELYKIEKHLLRDKAYEPFVARW